MAKRTNNDLQNTTQNTKDRATRTHGGELDCCGHTSCFHMRVKYLHSHIAGWAVLVYHIGDVMVSVLAWSVIDRGFEPWSDQIKDYTICICCFSAKHVALRGKRKDWLALGIRIMCPSGATCLAADCCFCELAL